MSNCKVMLVTILLLGLSLLIPSLPGFTTDGTGEKGMQGGTNISADKPKTTESPVTEKEKVGVLTDMPVYKPPKRGTPEGRVAGGTRGTKDATVILALAPDHVGLTVQEQPSLYWFLSRSTSYPIELTIIEDKAVLPTMEKRLNRAVQPGIQCIRLADYGVRLKTGVGYQWFVAIITDPERRSKDIIATGEIERVEFPRELRSKLEQAGKANAAHVYAETGLWYDALEAVSELVATTPDNTMFRKQRSSLLEQVGLLEVADYQMKH